MAGEVTGEQINTVLRLVKSMTHNGDVQLTILGRAFVVACKSCEVEEAAALAVLAGIFKEPVDLVALELLYDRAEADFNAWIAEHDPDGELTLLEQIDAYYAHHQGKD
jgi:hypothetical protein